MYYYMSIVSWERTQTDLENLLHLFQCCRCLNEFRLQGCNLICQLPASKKDIII